MSKARWGSVGFAVAILAIAVWAIVNLRVDNEITQFLPESEDRALAEIAQDISRSELNRQITITIESQGGREVAVQAALDLAEALEQIPHFGDVRTGPGSDMGEVFYSLYFSRRFGFWQEQPDDDSLSDRMLRERVQDLRSRLMGPTGAFVRQVAAEDPLLIFVRHLERMRDAQQGGLEVERGVVVSEDHAIVWVSMQQSPFDTEAGLQVQNDIERAFAAVNEAHNGTLTIEHSGIYRFAIVTEATMRADIMRISIAGSVAVVLLLLLLFRSPRILILSVLPLGVGFVTGLASTLILFGRVHGITLAFGATLIGVAVDYVAHYLNHHVLEPHPKGAGASLRTIWPGLALGATTTIFGLVGLAWTSFPGIREMAVFASVGVAFALIATRVLLPPWLPTVPKPTSLHRGLHRLLERSIEKLGPRVLWSTVIVAVAFAAVGLSRLRWEDDLRALYNPDPELLAEEERVRARVNRSDVSRFIVASGEDDESALRANDAVYEAMVAARSEEELEHFRSAHSFLWSAETQRRSAAELRAADLGDRLSAILQEEGFAAAAFSPFEEARAQPFAPLRYSDLRDSPLGEIVRAFRVELDEGRVAYVTLLSGANDVDAVRQRLEPVEGAVLFDQAEFMGQAYARFRRQTMQLIGAGLFAVFAIIFLRYRDVKLALAAFAPAVMAATLSISALGILGYTANLLHVVALLLVLSMGVDYGVFIVESHRRSEGNAVAHVSLVVAGASTIFSFGLLAMSANAALRSLGLVTAVGVFASLVLAPSALLLLRRKRR